MSTIKKLDELGISPAPWNVDDKDVRDASGYGVVYYFYSSCIHKEDAKLISAAPELYEALRLYVEGTVCSRADRDCATCPNNLCVTKKARAALAKAGGEDVE